MRTIPVLAAAGLLAACTQQPAQVVLRGAEDFSRHMAELSPAAGGNAAPAVTPIAVQPPAQYAASAPVAPVDQHTSSIASVSSVSSSDLPPPAAAPVKAAVAEKPMVTKAPQLAKADTSRVRKPYIWPVEGGKVTAKFGPAGRGKANDGITIAADSGEPVYASADGEVVFVGDQLKGYGHMVLIKHKGGINTTYAHLEKASVLRYDRVKQGDIIGYVGSSGHVKQPQLYFAMRSGTKPVDPQRYLSSSYAEK